MDDFLNWWRWLPFNINPVLVELGPLKLQYYGLMYIVAFGITYLLVLHRIKHETFGASPEQVKDLATYMILGLIVGARLGYVVFYNPAYYLSHPLEIVLPFSFSNGVAFTGISGMSYHGGLIGVILFSWWYIRKAGLDFFEMADLVIPAIPLGYTFGRIGNFINGELYGRATTSAIGMYFPLDPQKALRHPSQLYEAFLEGIVLFSVLWPLRKRQGPRGRMLGFYLLGYGLVRFFIEYYREPDAHLGFVFLSLSMGQLLCAAMILTGISIYLYLRRKEGSEKSDR